MCCRVDSELGSWEPALAKEMSYKEMETGSLNWK